MYITTTKSKSSSGKEHHSILLRESYRQGKQVKNRTIANFTKLPAKDIDAMKLALKHREDLSVLGSLSETVTLEQGPSVGAVWTVAEVAKTIGITKAMGTSQHSKLALFQILARTIEQGSRLSAVRGAQNNAGVEILGIQETFNEDTLYNNLDWIATNQERIEDKLFAQKKRATALFLYDVTSSYLEGEQNELASFGYNRDRKKGKQQIVVGLLCDEEGDPVSVQVFEGNTTDPKTFSDQVQKVTKRFNCSNVIMVGDRGMIKSAEIQTIHEHQLHYLTAITKPSIQKLINDNVLQHSLFDIELVEIEDDNIRYLLRRNPIRAAEIMHVRKAKQARIEKAIETSNTYLKEHPGGATTTQFKKLNTLIKTLKVNKWITLTSTGRIITLAVNQEVLDDLSKLDGCYVLKTDVPKDCASADTLHARYKDLGFVEYAFRTMKTTELEIRPIHVRSASHTRGHVFVVMLAYKIIRHLETLWKEENVTVHEGLQALKEICATKVTTPHGGSCLKVPTPRALPKHLLSRLSISLPPTLPPKQFSVVTRKSLVKS